VPAPTVLAGFDPATPNGAHGWYSSGDVDLTWAVAGATAIVGCVDETFDTDGVFTRSCAASSDGGTTGPTEVTVKRDVTPPEVGVTGVADAAVYPLGSVPVASCTASDATSGLDGPPTVQVTGGPTVGFFTATCRATDMAGSTASAHAGYQVTYVFSGFTGPLANPPTVNPLNAGSSVPIKFNLAGFQGLGIFAAGSPRIQTTNCTTGAAIGSPITTTASQPLDYDQAQASYVYSWKTQKNWAGSCGRLDVILIDGTTHSALVRFVK
jgi:hypothetical protein